MSQIIDAFMGVFMMVFMLLFGTSLVDSQVDTAQARSYKNSVIAELENSDYNPLVIKDCISQAKEDGYTLKVQLYSESADGTGTVVETESNDTGEVVAADVQLAYQYQLTFLGESSTHYVRGFAR